MKKIDKKVRNILLLFVVIFWIYFFIYNYFIRTRFSYELKIIDNKFIILSLGIMLFIQMLLVLSKLNINVINKLNILLNQLFNNIYWEPLNFIFDKIIKNVSAVGDLLMFLSKNIVKYSPKISRYFGIKCCLIIDTIPRIVLTITFIIDNFIYNQVFYLNKIIPIFIAYITLLRLLLHMLHDFSQHNKKDPVTFYNITQLNDIQYKINLYCNRYVPFKNIHISTDMIIKYTRQHN